MHPSVFYEPGMKIAYSPSAQTVTVSFRGRTTVLAERYSDANEAYRAGERHCMNAGWKLSLAAPAITGNRGAPATSGGTRARG